MLGSSGTDLKKICPVKATEFKLMMENVEKHSFMLFSVTSSKVHVTFRDENLKDFYKITIAKD